MAYIKNTWVDDDPSKPLSAARMNNLESQYDQMVTFISGAYVPLVGTGHIGIEKSNPVNARLYIGSGTGSLTDKGVMGIKVKIDTPSDVTPDGIQSDVNIVAGAPAGSSRAVLGRVDMNDNTTTLGDTVGVWGDVIVAAGGSRPVWGGNFYSKINSGVAYPGAAIGIESGVANFGISDNNGGGLHVVGKSTGAKIAFGLAIDSDPNADGAAGAAPNAFRTNLLMRSDNAPSDNYMWIGAVGSGTNLPTGTPVFQITAGGLIQAGGSMNGANPVIQLQRSSQANASMEIGASSGTEIRFGNGSAATDTSVKRGGASIVSVGPALWVGDSVSSGSGFAQLWEQSTDPSNASTKAGRVFVRPNPGNTAKSQLCVRFQTGSTIVIASEA